MLMTVLVPQDVPRKGVAMSHERPDQQRMLGLAAKKHRTFKTADGQKPILATCRMSAARPLNGIIVVLPYYADV